MNEDKILLILFGRLGCGKNFVGRALARHFGAFFYDADEDLTLAMRDAIQSQAPFTDEMREYYDLEELWSKGNVVVKVL